MKKRKLFTVLTAVGLAAIMCVSLTGCNKSGSGAGNTSGIMGEVLNSASSQNDVFAEAAVFDVSAVPEAILLNKDRALLINTSNPDYESEPDANPEIKWTIYDKEGNRLKDASVTLKGTEGIPVSFAKAYWNENGDVVVANSTNNEQGDTVFVVSSYSEDGAEKGSVSVSVPGDLNAFDVAVTKDGWIIVQGNKDICVFDSNGTQKGKIPVAAGGEFAGLTMSASGDVWAICYDAGYDKHVMPLDLNNCTMKDFGVMDFSLGSNFFYDASGNTYCRSRDGVYFIQLTDDGIKTEPVFGYMDSDVDGDNVGKVAAFDETSMMVAFRDSEESSCRVALYNKVAPENIKDKEIIVLGSVGFLSPGIKRAVLDFNKKSDQYRVCIADYSEFTGAAGDDYDMMGPENQLKNDLVSKNGPDIICTSGIINLDSYINKGIFVDLYPYMEKKGIRKEDYLENILKCGEKDGKLYYISPQFNIMAAQGKKSVMGDRKSISFEELQEMEKEYDCVGRSINASRGDLITSMLAFTGDTFYNMDTAECHFDSPEFISYLEWIKEFPDGTEEDYSEMYMKREQMFHENKLLFDMESYSNFEYFNEIEQVLIGEETVVTGFPGSGTEGGLVYSSEGFAISEDSKHKEEAFEIFAYLLSEDYQMPDESKGNDSVMYAMGFPLMKKAFDRMGEMALEKPYIIKDGKKEEMDLEAYSYGRNKLVKIDPISRDRLEYFKSVIEHCTGTMRYDEKLKSIIEEEAAYYFAGQKSAEEVAQVIQNRAQNYMRENR